MNFRNLIQSDADAIINDVGGPAESGTYTPPTGSAVAVTVMVEERPGIALGDEYGSKSRRAAAITIPYNQVNDVQRTGTVTFASGPYAGVWTVETIEARTWAMTIAVCTLEKMLSTGGDGARKVGG